jgi:hypothetical protein
MDLDEFLPAKPCFSILILVQLGSHLRILMDGKGSTIKLSQHTRPLKDISKGKILERISPHSKVELISSVHQGATYRYCSSACNICNSRI